MISHLEQQSYSEEIVFDFGIFQTVVNIIYFQKKTTHAYTFGSQKP